MRRFRMFVKRGFQFSEPSTNLDVPVPAHDALVLKYQNSVFGDVFSYLFDNCKANTVKSYRRTRLMLKSRKIAFRSNRVEHHVITKLYTLYTTFWPVLGFQVHSAHFAPQCFDDFFHFRRYVFEHR